MLATSAQLEVLDLRHFSAPALRPLLEDEAGKWERRLLWDYSRSTELLLDYVNSRSLTGYVAARHGRVAGYAFGVCEAAKAVMGDVYAFGEGEQLRNPTCEVLLDHLIETLQATPGVGRVESQLLLFPERALAGPFESAGFQAYARCFMVCDLGAARPAAETEAGLGPTLRMERWQPEAYLPAAALIQDAYLGHTDSEINDQYRSLQGAQRFLHNIVHFPGCGVFDPAHSWVLRDAMSGAMEGMVLCSRVRGDAAHITQLCVRGELRGRGLGAELLRHCLAELGKDGLRTVSLTVTESNRNAMVLYERHGFRVRQRFEAWVWEKGRK
jgi:ribosomal protein S18 acetylase RimI-like enzyme